MAGTTRHGGSLTLDEVAMDIRTKCYELFILGEQSGSGIAVARKYHQAADNTLISQARDDIINEIVDTFIRYETALRRLVDGDYDADDYADTIAATALKDQYCEHGRLLIDRQ